MTHQALLLAEKRLGYPLTITQGSYNAGGVSASAGTHDGGGVIDLAPYDWERKVRVLRSIGFAAWHRTAIPGLWPEHIHAVLIGNAKLSPAAASQVDDYHKHLDGLARHQPDNTWHPDPIRPYRWLGRKVEEIKVATFNAGDGPDGAKARDLAELCDLHDVIALEEWGDRWHVHIPDGWALWAGDKPGAKSTPILYRTSLKVTGKGSVELSAAGKIPDAGPGPAHVKPKHANWIAVRVAGRTLRFVSFHGVTQPDHDPQRRAIGRKQIAGLVKLSRKWRFSVVVIAGDFNQGWSSNLLDPLRKAGFRLASTGPTHGNHTLDLIVLRPAANVVTKVITKALSKVVIRDTSSDHDVPSTTVQIVRRPY
jgi:hypothetical protein